VVDDPLSQRLADTVRAARRAQSLSVVQVADAAHVSRAMVGKIERGEVQPTAALLARLSGALGMTLSELVARAEGDDRRVARRSEQPVWVDPVSGYRRRAVSPPAGTPLELVEVELPAGARVALPAESYSFIHQQIWVLDGALCFREGEVDHHLDAGDCLQLGDPAPCVFINETNQPCRYLVALTKKAR